MKKIDEMRAQLTDLKAEAQKFLDDNKVKEAQDKMKDIKNLKASIEMQEALDKEEEETLKAKAPADKKKKEQKDTVKEFASAARKGFQNAMSEGSNDDGGYTVPEDISTRIQTLRESADALEPLVRVESVNTLSGARTLKKRSQQTGFSKVAENGSIGQKATPQFGRINYTVDKYAGYFPVTNELLADSDANIVSTLVNWIGNESRVTRNKLILDVISGTTKKDLVDIDGIKKALNVTLLSAFRKTAKIITNQDGFQYLDTLKDSDGRYLLQPLVTDPTKYILFGVPVVVVGNDTLVSDDSTDGELTIPVIIGDLKEGVVMFDRKKLDIKSSDVAMNAFENDVTLFRAIEREDVVLWDDQAFINGTITIQV